MEKQPGEKVSVNDWNNDVVKLRYQDISTPGTYEVRMVKEGDYFVLLVYDGTQWQPVGAQVSGALTGIAGAHSGHPVFRIRQTADTSYNIGDVHGEIQFFTEDPNGAFPGVNAAIKSETSRFDGISNPDAALSFWVSNIDGLLIKALLLKGDGTLEMGGNVVWNAGNHGPESGLDADMVDGYHMWSTTVSVPAGSGSHEVLFPSTFQNAFAVFSHDSPTAGKIVNISTTAVYLGKHGTISWNATVVVFYQ